MGAEYIVLEERLDAAEDYARHYGTLHETIAEAEAAFYRAVKELRKAAAEPSGKVRPKVVRLCDIIIDDKDRRRGDRALRAEQRGEYFLVVQADLHHPGQWDGSWWPATLVQPFKSYREMEIELKSEDFPQWESWIEVKGRYGCRAIETYTAGEA